MKGEKRKCKHAVYCFFNSDDPKLAIFKCSKCDKVLKSTATKDKLIGWTHGRSYEVYERPDGTRYCGKETK